MKYLKDPNNIVSRFSKYVLLDKNYDEVIAYLLSDILQELSLKFDNKNRLVVVGLFQDIFDILNPYTENIFSAFDVDEKTDGVSIIFFNENQIFERTGELIRKRINVLYKEQ